jgi:hydrogenase maturation protease
MNERSARILVLALGNDLLGDDGVGLEAARQIAGQVDGSVDVVETGEAGLALLELMEGYECALLIDSVVTGRYPPGTVIEFSPAGLPQGGGALAALRRLAGSNGDGTPPADSFPSAHPHSGNGSAEPL